MKNNKPYTTETFKKKLKELGRDDIEIIGEYVNNKTKIRVKCTNQKCGREWDIIPSKLIAGQGCGLCKRKIVLEETRKKNAESFWRQIKEKGLKGIKILGEYTGAVNKIKCECSKGHVWYPSADSLLHGHSCPYCYKEEREEQKEKTLLKEEEIRRKKEIKHQNDKFKNSIGVKRPDLIKYLKNEEDAYGFYSESNKKIDLKCPYCGFEKKIRVQDFTRRGFSCSVCGDGVSFPNKFIRNFLKMLDVCFYPEWSDYWCKNYRYDVMFVYNDKKYLIECDGEFHFKDGFNTSVTEVQKKDEEKDRLAKENGYILIRINCYNNYYKNIIKEIKKSQLSDIFNIKDFNWQECVIKSQKSIVISMCEYYNNNLLVTNKELSQKFGVSEPTVIDYLTRGKELGICPYYRKGKNQGRIISVLGKNQKIIKTYPNVLECARKWLKGVGNKDVHKKAARIRRAIKRGQDIDGYTFKYAETLSDIAPDYNAEVDKMFNPTTSK